MQKYSSPQLKELGNHYNTIGAKDNMLLNTITYIYSNLGLVVPPATVL